MFVALGFGFGRERERREREKKNRLRALSPPRPTRNQSSCLGEVTSPYLGEEDEACALGETKETETELEPTRVKRLGRKIE